MTVAAAAAALRFLESLEIAEGPRAGKRLRLAPFQKQFVRGALAHDVNTAVLSIGRGNAKTALCAGIALASLVGVIDKQPAREIVIAARTLDQARIAWRFVSGFARSLPEKQQSQLIFRRAPRLEIEYEGDGGHHIVKAIASDGRSSLGNAPTMCLMDERGHWMADRGDELEHMLLSGLGKRNGRAFIISTSAPDDSHPFSQWIDNPLEGTFVQEHRPPPGLPADDLESLLIANPGAPHGIGASQEWLVAQARRAIDRGGSALASFRLLNRNERVNMETRDLLLTTDQWLACETEALPPRSGPCILGIDLGGSASMSAAAFFWPQTGRLEAVGTFPGKPTLSDRGARDGVGQRYQQMYDRKELFTLGDQTVPVAGWLRSLLDRVPDGVTAIVADRYKAAELGEALVAADVKAPIIWRGMGFRDGGEDCERFRRAAFDGLVKSAPSLLLRSAFGDAVCLRDAAGNIKLAKARSKGRIDPAAASVLAAAEGVRQAARPATRSRAAWA